MPVREVLATHTALELGEWNAYERAFGPIDGDWRDENAAQINELLQAILHITVQANSKDGTSPQTTPKHKARPHEMWDEYLRMKKAGEID